jgi:hypothetical protein
MIASELRIGNLLDYNGKIVKVNTLAIDFHGNQTMLASKENFLWNVSKIDGIKPIPLTEEWLLKFGFDERLHGWWSEKIFLRKDENGNLWFDWNGTTQTESIEIKYLHELQNLYFALAGNELKIK